jgi:translocation and assembly module TamB
MSLEYKKFIKRIAKWSAAFVLALLLLGGVFFGLVQTRWVKQHMAGWITAIMSRDFDFHVKAIGLRGLIPFSVRLDHVVISDGTGVWLRIEEMDCRWSPTALLKGRIHINKLHIAAIHLDRVAFSPKEKQTRQPAWSAWAARIPSLVPRDFAVQRLSMGESLLGERASFTVRCRMEAEEMTKGSKGFLSIDRTDGPQASVRINWSVTGAFLKLSAVAQEEGRLCRALSGLEQVGALSIELEGQGPIKAWKGRLLAKGDYIGALESTIELGVQKDLRLKGDGYIALNSSILPAQVAPLLKDGRNHFALDVQYRGTKELTIHRLDCESERFDIRLEGRLDLRKEIIDVEFASEVADISFLNEITDSKVKGRAVMEGGISGSFQKPRAMVSLSLIELAMGELYATKMTSDIELEVMGGFPSSFQGLSIRTKGAGNGLSHHGKKIILPEIAFQWSATAEVKSNSPITVNELELSSESFLLRFSGILDPSVMSLKGDALLDIRDLKPFSGLLGTELAGSAQMRTRLGASGRARSLSADIEGETKELGLLPAFLAALAGREVEYQGHLDLTNAGALKISAFRAHSSSVEVSGDQSIDLSTQEVSGQWAFRIPSLSVLSEAVDQALTGSLDLEVEMGGSLPAPTLQARATGHGVGLDDMLMEQVQMEIHAEDLRKAPQGHLVLELQRLEYLLKAESDFLWERDRLVLSGVTMAAAGTKATGDLAINFRDMTGEGWLQGQSDDLLRTSSLWGEKISGRASFEAIFLSRDEEQDMELDLWGSKLQTRFGYADELTLQARLKDLFGARGGAAEMRMKSFQKGELDLQTLTWAAEGQMNKATFSGSAAGHFRKRFEFRTRVDLDLSPNELGIQVEQLDGRFADYPFALIRPVVIRRKPHEFLLESFAFHLDKGRFEGSGRLEKDGLVFDAHLEDLPVEILNLIAPAEFLGSVNGRLHIAGRLDRPEALMELRADDIRLKGAAFQGLPPARLLTHITVEEDRLQADLSLEGLFEKPFRADMEVPAVISLWPLSFSLKAEDEIRGRVSADLDLSLIPAFFYSEDQRLGGRLLMDLVLAGGAATPEVKGTVGLSNGSYENLRTGIILSNVQILAECERNRIVLTDARGTDGGSGTVTAQGWLELFSPEGFSFQLNLALNSVTPVQRDDLTAMTSGDLRLSGTPREALLSGALTLGPAEIRIPDRFPPEIPDLEVVEINRLDQGDPEQPAEKKAPGKLALDLKAEVPGRAFVRGRGLDSEWKGDLHLVGNAGEPSVTGVLSVVRGRYNFLGKPFSLTGGTLTFGGHSPPSPTLEFSAEYERSDMMAHIRLSGPLTSLVVSMDSEPPLPSDEILSRLLFGRSVAYISPMQALQLAQALNAMRGSGSTFGFMDRTRRILHVDQLDIKSSEEDDGGTSVRVGKYVLDNVYLEIEQGVGTEGGKISSEVELTPNITFESETGTDAHVGVGLNWKRDY